MTSGPLWVRWYPADFRGSAAVQQMSLEEEFLYRVLLDMQATSASGVIEFDRERLARAAKMSPEAFDAAWIAVRRCFEEVETGRFRNVRMEQERERSLRAITAAQVNGAKGGRPRKGSRKGVEKPGGSVSETGRVPRRVTQRKPAGEPNREPRGSSVPSEPTAPEPKPRANRAVSDHQRLVDHWTEGWLATRGAEWTWQPADLAAVKRLRSLAKGDADEVAQRMDRLLESPDAWLAENASPRLLVARWNQLGAAPARPRTREQDHVQAGEEAMARALRMMSPEARDAGGLTIDSPNLRAGRRIEP